MNQIIKSLLVILVASVLLLTSCRPPAVEGTVMNINTEKFDEAITSANEAVKTNPENAEAWFYWGWLHGDKNKDYAKMAEGFEKAMSINPQQKVVYQGGNVALDGAIKNAKGLMYQEAYNAGIQDYNVALKMEDGEEKIVALGKARDKFVAAQSIDATKTHTYQPLGITYLFLKDTSNAEMTIAEGLKVSPDNEALVTAGAEVYMMAGKIDKAVELFTKALEINPENTKIYQRLGSVESKRKNWDKANAYYQKAVEIDPENSDLIYNIAVGLYNQEKLEEAIPYFEKSIALEPDNELVYTILASCYNRTEKLDKAIPFLKDATQLFPEKAELWSYLAVAYAGKGMTKEANAANDKAKELQ